MLLFSLSVLSIILRRKKKLSGSSFDQLTSLNLYAIAQGDTVYVRDYVYAALNMARGSWILRGT